MLGHWDLFPIFGPPSQWRGSQEQKGMFIQGMGAKSEGPCGFGAIEIAMLPFLTGPLGALNRSPGVKLPKGREGDGEGRMRWAIDSGWCNPREAARG